MKTSDVLEFYGLPGAGKTTVANELVATLRSDGMEVMDSGNVREWLMHKSRLHKGTMVVRQAGVFTRNLSTILEFFLASRPVTLKTIRRLNRLLVGEILRREFVREVAGTTKVVLEDGFVHAIWVATQFSEVVPRNLLVRIMSECLSQLPRRIVFVQISPERAAERVWERNRRGKVIYPAYTKERLTAHFRKATKVMEFLLEAVQVSGWPILVVEGAAPIGHKVEQIAAWLNVERGTKGAPRSV